MVSSSQLAAEFGDQECYSACAENGLIPTDYGAPVLKEWGHKKRGGNSAPLYFI
jgi:hypothetical protein